MVRELVDAQFPGWRQLAVMKIVAAGGGPCHLPGRRSACGPVPAAAGGGRVRAAAAGGRAAAVPELAEATRFATPVPVAIGEPGAGYPLASAVQTWLPGVTAAVGGPGGSVAFAHDLVGFISGVRAIGTAGRTFSGKGRGGDLRCHGGWMQTCLERSGQLPGVPRLARMWQAMRAVLRGAAGDVMSHRDLIPGTVLASGGRLTGILDAGDLGPADPALDLVAAWHLPEDAPRRVLREDLRCQDLEWERGRAWALEQAMGLAWYYAQSNPAVSGLGRRTLQRIQASTAPARTR
jgi:aminoglycoside phosphotransferase (APT) family kinase protein